MGDLLHLRDDHEQTQLLLPWKVNGSLDAQDAALVDAHLEQCDQCRADLAAEMTLRDRYAATPAVAAPGPRPVPDALVPGSRVTFLRRRVALGWAVAGQVAVAAAAAAAFMVVMPAPPPKDDYRLLASASQPPKGNAIVLFAPDMTQRELRTALESAGARIVEGPTKSGAFVLQLEPSSRSAALGTLRGNRQVLLAEPIDPAAGP